LSIGVNLLNYNDNNNLVEVFDAFSNEAVSFLTFFSIPLTQSMRELDFDLGHKPNTRAYSALMSA